MAGQNFSIEKLLAGNPGFSSSTATMMLNAQHAFNLALAAGSGAVGGVPGPIDFFNPYAFPPTTSQAQNLFAAPGQFPFLVGFPPHPYFAHAGIFPPGFCPPNMNGKRKRRHRTIFTDAQLTILEKAFTVTQYPDLQMRDKLASQCQLKEERVEVWFKNRRAKNRKKNPEEKKKTEEGGAGNSDDEELSASDSEPTCPKRKRSCPSKESSSHASPTAPKQCKVEIENVPTELPLQIKEEPQTQEAQPAAPSGPRTSEAAPVKAL